MSSSSHYHLVFNEVGMGLGRQATVFQRLLRTHGGVRNAFALELSNRSA